MKNVFDNLPFSQKGVKKVLTIMRNVVIMMFVIAFQLKATSSYSQETTFSVKENGIELTELFRQIEKQSEFLFFYLDAEVKNIRVDVNVKNDNVHSILDKVLKNTDLTFMVNDRNVNILRKSRMEVMPQQQTKRIITGTIIENNGEPIIGANVVEKGTTNGIITDVDGKFSLSVGPNAILHITYIGYISQDISIGSQQNVNVTLLEDTQNLEEVVVVGYGIQKKVNLTGAITVSDAKKLENRPITTTSQALQGLNGLYVNQNTGQPGNDGATIRIRGVGTLNNNDPLVLVDGISYPLSDINSNEIESISVLKDAASTAVYGSRAANGVILIKTKSGKRGDGYRVNYNNYFGVEKAVDLPDVEWDPIRFMEYKNIALTNEGKPIEYTQAEIDEYRAGIPGDPNGYMYPRTNAYDIALKTGFMHEHNIIVSGGGDKHNLALTLGVMSQEGILKYEKSKANKYSMGLNGKVDINNFLSIGGKISAIYRKNNEPYDDMGMYWERAIYRTPPIYPILIEDGRYGNTWLRSTGLNSWLNTLSRLKEGEQDHTRTRILANVFADIKLPFNIIYKVNLSANTSDYTRRKFTPYLENVNPKTLYPTVVSANAIGYRRNEKELNLTGFHTLEWSNVFAGVHTVGALLGNSYESFSWEYFSSQKEGAMDNILTDMNVFLRNPVTGGNSTESGILSYFGRLNYNYNDKYLLEASFRYDGSSRFAKGNRWGFFPSFSLGWRVDQEGFLENVDWLSGLKPRFSWGKIGNQQIDLWSYVNAVGLSQNYSFGNTVAIGAATTAATDPEISWEATTMTNLGFDILLFKGKVSTTFELYNKNTDGILRSVNYARQVGNLTGPTTNVGSMNNKGLEVIVNYQDRKGDFSYEAGGSFAYNKNEVTNLNGQEIIDGRFITKEGSPYRSWYLLESDGYFQSQAEIDAHTFQNIATKPGYIRYKNQNDDNIIDNDDRKTFYSVVPEFTYSFNLGVGYKGLQLTAFFQGVGKVYTYMNANICFPYNNGAGVSKEWLTDSWTPENPNARLPILTTTPANELNFANSDFWLQNASYLRMKNIQLTYTIPSNLLQKLSIKDLKVFVNGQNLLTFTKMRNWDPEKDLGSGNIYAYPQEKIYTAGVNITF